MLITEVFNKKQALSDFDNEQNNYNKHHDTETSIADMIITDFEQGNISFDEAEGQLRDKGLGGWMHELHMADELQQDKGNNH